MDTHIHTRAHEQENFGNLRFFKKKKVYNTHICQVCVCVCIIMQSMFIDRDEENGQQWRQRQWCWSTSSSSAAAFWWCWDRLTAAALLVSVCVCKFHVAAARSSVIAIRPLCVCVCMCACVCVCVCVYVCIHSLQSILFSFSSHSSHKLFWISSFFSSVCLSDCWFLSSSSPFLSIFSVQGEFGLFLNRTTPFRSTLQYVFL